MPKDANQIVWLLTLMALLAMPETTSAHEEQEQRLIGGTSLGANPVPKTEEDRALQRFYASADYNAIARRYRSSDRVRKLSTESRPFLVRALLPEHSSQLFEGLVPVVSDSELRDVALTAVLRNRTAIRFSESATRRLNRSSAGRFVLMLNNRTMPLAPRALAPLREARMAVIDAFFFKPASPDQQGRALQTLATLTIEAFRNGTFSTDVPAPPTAFAPRNVTDLALKLALLPYISDADGFVSLFRAVNVGSAAGETR